MAGRTTRPWPGPWQTALRRATVGPITWRWRRSRIDGAARRSSLVGADSEDADMPKKRKVADAQEFDVARERLWQWLVENAGAGANTEHIQGDPAALRRMEVHRIHFEGHNSSDPAKKRASVAAGVLLELDMVKTERETAAWYLQFRVDTLDKAVRAYQAVEALRRSWGDLAERAKADRPSLPLLTSYWPERVAELLAARDVAFVAALAFIEDYRQAVENLGDNVWGADATPNMLRKIDSIALHLDEGGFNASEIADLLDETNDNLALKTDRWRQRVKWARSKVTRRSEAGPPISSEKQAETTADSSCAASRSSSDTTPTPDRHSRRERR